MTLPDDGAYPNDLYGIASVSSHYVLTVGDGGYAAVWNGKQWTAVDSPNFANAITALSETDAWAVGSGPAGAIEHWNGVKWSPSPLTLPAGWSPHLEGVSSAGPDDVWAVGTVEIGTGKRVRQRVLVAHWNGTDWVLGRSPTVQAAFSELTGVSMLPNGDAWAVGRYRKKPLAHGETGSLIERYTPC